MDEYRTTQPLRIVLRLGATVFGLSALFLLALPALFLDLLALPSGADQQWSMRMIAITLVALTGNMLSVSLYVTERSVRFSAFVMQLSAFGLGVITLLIPTALTWFTILYAVVGFGFSAAYSVFLFRKA